LGNASYQKRSLEPSKVAGDELSREISEITFILSVGIVAHNKILLA